MDLDPEVEELIEEAVVIDAAPERVWALVADPRLMRRWSPQVARVLLRTPGPVGVGSRTLNINRAGVLVWTTRSQVVDFEPLRRFAIRIRDNRSVWSFELEPVGTTRTRLVQRRETPQGVAERALALERRFMGGVPAFQVRLRAGMRTTLERVKRAAER
ncbi:SRPBCC family protein [Pimelobacter simplex]|uniref:SRPBCC family protein n=1 Tax=Nocardioides simplex TaxID=2045 RepID=UPI003AAC1A83